MAYDNRVVEEVRYANDVVDVVGQYVPLKKAGRNFKGICPFHDEKTPSFMVNPEKQIFHCFGCGNGGDVFAFLMRYENMNFPEALRTLAERANIHLPETQFKKGEGPSETEKIYEAYRLATQYYQTQLEHPEQGAAAREYLKNRDFNDEIIKEFKLGWAPAVWRGLFEFLSKKGISENILFQAGLIKRAESGHVYDVFRGRALFPIHNLQGKVIGFGGRLIDKSEGPKYLNSPENPVFRKRRELFGLYQAKKFIDRAKPRLIVVEGYVDFLSLYSAGFKNTVATLGTALTEDHVQVLKRFVEEAVVIYDGDKAGVEASLKGLEVFLVGGMNVKLVRMPEGIDPDDFIKKKGTDAFDQLIKSAKDFFDYKLDIAFERYDVKDSLGLVKVTNDFLETLSKIQSSILQSHYLSRLASALQLDEGSLRSELAKLKQRGAGREQSVAPKQTKKLESMVLASVKDELTILALMIEDRSFRERGMNELSENDFQIRLLGNIFNELVTLEQNHKPVDLNRMLNFIQDENIKNDLVGLAAFDWNFDDRLKAFDDCLLRIRKKNLKKQLNEIRSHIERAEKDGNQAQALEFMKEYQLLMQKMK